MINKVVIVKDCLIPEFTSTVIAEHGNLLYVEAPRNISKAYISNVIPGRKTIEILKSSVEIVG